MATKRQKMKVGVFLIVCFGFIIGGSMLIQGQFKSPGTEYWLEFEESILGLYEGGMVEYLGVPVGKVINITVTETQKAHVDILINPEKVVLRKGVEGQLVLYSIAAGTMAISLSGGDPEGVELPSKSRITTRKSTIEAISSQITDIMGEISSIASKVNSQLDALEDGDVKEIVDRVKGLLERGEGLMDKGTELANETTKTVGDLRGEASRVVDALEARSEDLRRVAKEMEELLKTANVKLEEVDVKETQIRVHEALERVTSLAESVEGALEKMDTLTADVLHETGNVEHSLRVTMKELRDAFDSMRLLADQLKEDPSQLVRGKGNFKAAPK